MIKSKRTAAHVADILAAVESVLVTDGRPRKLPSKPRAIALTTWGKAIPKVTKSWIWDVDKVSLLGAFQLARIEAGVGKKAQMIAARYYLAGCLGDWAMTLSDESVESWLIEIDNEELDTRALARTAKAARRRVEKVWGVDTYQTKDVLAAA